ncbi:YhdP family protein [Methylophilaceae bacterium]|nr:YhdP family protein [Methylophilaceae bacterium]
MKKAHISLIKKLFLWISGTIFSLFIVAYIAFYFLVQTNLDYYKKELVNIISQETKKEVTIEKFDANWNVTNPQFIIENFSIYANKSEKSFTFKKFEVDVSWWSLIKFELVLDQVTLYDLAVEIQKNSESEFLIGGWKVAFDPSSEDEFDGKLIDWLLNQDELQLVNSKIIWIDKTRANSPPLILSDVNISYHTSDLLSYLDRHVFYLDFYTSAGTSKKVSLTGHFDADSINELQKADGAFTFKFDDLNLYAFSPWIDYPLSINDGSGSLSINMEFEDGKLREGGSTFSIKDLNANTLKNSNQGMVFQEIKGDVNLKLVNDDLNIILDNLFLTTNSKLKFEDSSASVKYNLETSQINKLTLIVDRFDIASVKEISNQFLSENDESNIMINALSATGEIDDLKLKWQRTHEEESPKIKLSAKLLKIEVNEFEDFPGLKNVTGEIKIDDEKGIIKSVSRDLTIIKNNVFRSPLKLNQFTGAVTWKNKKYMLNDIVIKDDFMEVLINGDVEYQSLDDLYVDLNIDSPIINIPNFKVFYPKQIGKDGLGWLDTSLLEGTAENTSLQIKGKVKDFPFIDENNKPDLSKGFFRVQTSIKDSFIEYGDNWPEMEKFDAEVSVNGGDVFITSQKGELDKSQVKVFNGSITPFTADEVVLNIDMILDSSAENIIYAVNNSPIKEAMKGMSEDMEGKGDGELKLVLNVGFDDLDNIPFKGTYEFLGSTLENPQLEIPPISDLRGKVEFDSNDVKITNLDGKLFGEPLNLKLKNADGATIIDLKGLIGENMVKELLGENWLKNISGQANWEGLISLSENKSEFKITSDLLGIQIKNLSFLDKAKNKSEDTALKLTINKQSTGEDSDVINITLGDHVKGLINSANDENGDPSLTNGLIEVNSDKKIQIPESGIVFIANLNEVDLEELVDLIPDNESEISDIESSQSKSMNIEAVLNIKKLNAYGYIFNNFKFKLRPEDSGIIVQLNGEGARGNILWNPKKDLIKARFEELHLIGSDESIEEWDDAFETEDPIIKNAPKIDVKIQEFLLKSKYFDNNLNGNLTFQASKSNDKWFIDLFKFLNPDYALKVTGIWHDESPNPDTEIDFDWKITDLDKTLEEFNLDNLLTGGTGQLNGKLSWPQSPWKFDKNKASGSISINIDKGVILEAQPGAMGRLFGLLSLQSLPSRLTLDFSDIFADGFAFDSIDGLAELENSNIHSDNFEIKGPAADIFIKGDVNYKDETQDLVVTITPNVTDTMSVAALAGGPIVGAAAFVLQKLLNDPLNEVLTDQYRLTGSWADPQETPIDRDTLKNVGEGITDQIDEQIINPTQELFK